MLGYPVEVRHLPSKAYRETPPKQSPVHTRLCGICVTYSPPLLCYFCEQLSQIKLVNIFLEYLLLYLTLKPAATFLETTCWNFRVLDWSQNGPKMGHLTANNGRNFLYNHDSSKNVVFSLTRVTFINQPEVHSGYTDGEIQVSFEI